DVQVGLGRGGQGALVVVEPVEEVQRDEDAGACVPGGAGDGAGLAAPGAGPAQDLPVSERPDQRGVVGGSVLELVFQPGGDAVEVIVALRQHACGDEQVAQVAFGLPGGQGVEQLVGDRLTAAGQCGETA